MSGAAATGRRHLQKAEARRQRSEVRREER
jgi:hypothetical protein